MKSNIGSPDDTAVLDFIKTLCAGKKLGFFVTLPEKKQYQNLKGKERN